MLCVELLKMSPLPFPAEYQDYVLDRYHCGFNYIYSKNNSGQEPGLPGYTNTISQ